MAIIAKSREFVSLIDPAAPLTCIGRDFGFTEDRSGDASVQTLYFSDIPEDARWAWNAEAGMALVLKPTFKGNGMALDRARNLLVCEQSSICLARIDKAGRREVIAYQYQGKYLNSPNDVVTRVVDGSIYFTDPDYGRWNDEFGAERTRNGVGYRGVFRLPGDGDELELLVDEDEFDQPNGLSLSRGRSSLRKRLSKMPCQGIRCQV